VREGIFETIKYFKKSRENIIDTHLLFVQVPVLIDKEKKYTQTHTHIC